MLTEAIVVVFWCVCKSPACFRSSSPYAGSFSPPAPPPATNPAPPTESALLTRTTVAQIFGFAHSCTANSSARRSSGPPKNGTSRRYVPPCETFATPPGVCRSTKSATSVRADANSARTNCECEIDASRSSAPAAVARNRTSNGFCMCDVTRGVAKGVASAVCCAADE